MVRKIVIFGTSNILSDLFDCASANGLSIAKVVLHHPEPSGERNVSLADRLVAFQATGGSSTMQPLDEFRPSSDEVYILGPTTPARAALACELVERFDLTFTTLVHPRAYVSPQATLGQGVFVGANSVIGPCAKLEEHVFVNRGVTIGHDTHIGAFSRIQPGSNIGGLSRLGRGVTVAIGATLIERLVVGDNAFIGAGSVVIADVRPDVMVIGNPARFARSIVPNT